VNIATPAPAFALLDDSGQLHTLGELLSQGGRIVLAFVSPGSAECLRAEAGFAQAVADGLRVLRVVPGDVADALGGLRQVGREVMDAYAVQALPSAMIIDANGWVGGAGARRGRGRGHRRAARSQAGNRTVGRADRRLSRRWIRP
jgi:hypothetical protein